MSAGMIQILVYAVFLGAMFYFLIFMPEKKRKKNYSSMMSKLKVNAEVVTKGGIVGKVISIDDKYIVIQTGSDRARIKFVKESVSQVISSEE